MTILIAMSTRTSHAVIRFGLGLRLDEQPPGDADAWLEAQIAAPAPAPEGPSVAQALQVRLDQLAASRTPPAMAGPTPQAQLLRSEAQAWARRRLETAQPFRERLVDFWMNHFTVSRRAFNGSFTVGCLEREAIRPHVTGSFADMLVAVTTHPAMLAYLDNAGSIGPNSPFGARSGRGLNENLAREVLELHSLSPAGGYTQGDVEQLARLLTGFSVEFNREPLGFVWRRATHEPGDKTILGRRFGEGQAESESALRFLATHPATYRHLALKLARHFIADSPPPRAVAALARTLADTGGDLAALTRRLIALPEAWEPTPGKFRTPQDHVIAACRAIGLPADRPDPVLGGLGTLNQPLWSALQPDGWADTAAHWATPEALMRRVDWSYTLAGRVNRTTLPGFTEAALGPLARAETVAEMRRAGSVRDAATLLLASPEFMHR